MNNITDNQIELFKNILELFALLALIYILLLGYLNYLSVDKNTINMIVTYLIVIILIFWLYNNFNLISKLLKPPVKIEEKIEEKNELEKEKIDINNLYPFSTDTNNIILSKNNQFTNDLDSEMLSLNNTEEEYEKENNKKLKIIMEGDKNIQKLYNLFM